MFVQKTKAQKNKISFLAILPSLVGQQGTEWPTNDWPDWDSRKIFIVEP